VCFSVNVNAEDSYYGIGLSTSGAQMTDMDKYVLGRVAITPYIYHVAPGTGRDIPSDQMVSGACVTDVMLTGTLLSFSRRLDGSGCLNALNLSDTTATKIAAARGPWISSAASAGIGQHPVKPAVASTVLSSTGSVAAQVEGATQSDYQTHGTLMVVAWVLLASLGIFTARFMRGLIKKDDCGGIGWFEIHISMQLSAALLTIASVWYISDKKGDNLNASEWKGKKTHMQLGVSVLALVVVQLLMGFMRNQISGPPVQGTADHGPRRWVFDYLHWGLGMGVWILAVAAIWYGTEKYEHNVPNVDGRQMRTALLAWAVIVILVFISLDITRASNTWDKNATPNASVWYGGAGIIAFVSIVCAIVICAELNA